MLDRLGCNDSLSGRAGDQLLKSVAGRLAVRAQGDTVARLNGDEFGIILPGSARADDAISVARKLLNVLGEPSTLEPRLARLLQHRGRALSAHGTTPAALVRSATAAVSHAKQIRTRSGVSKE